MSAIVAKSIPVAAKESTRPDEPLLEVRDLKVYFPFRRGSILRPEHGFVRAVDGVSFTIEAGETLGLVGESGCGKSTLGRMVLRLIEPDSGEVTFAGKNVLEASGAEMRGLRRDMQIVFQDPFG